jgi:hypothetical protein
MWGLSAKWRNDRKTEKDSTDKIMNQEAHSSNYFETPDDFVTLTDSDFELAIHSDSDEETEASFLTKNSSNIAG